MYRIYVRDTPLIISLQQDKNNATIDFNKLKLEISKRLIGSETEVIQIPTKDPEETFQLFCKTFHYIEAAGGLVQNQDKEYLFIHRLGKWDLPKGKLEKGEKINECAIREVEEECGITIDKVLDELPSSFHFYEHKGELILKRTYWYAMAYSGKQTLTPQTEEDITAAVWLPQSDFEKVRANTYPAIKDLLKYT